MTAKKNQAIRKKGLKKIYQNLPESLQKYFCHFSKLIDDDLIDVLISYLFSQVELAHNNTVYGSVVRVHLVHSDIAKNVVQTSYMTREHFRRLYKNITGKSISKEAIDKIMKAEKIRDRILHGKHVKSADKREAIQLTLEYSKLLNEQVYNDAEFKPFGTMKGFNGRGKFQSKKSTSRLILIGMGLLSDKNTEKNTKNKEKLINGTEF